MTKNRSTQPAAGKRAAIYVRVSSEVQAHGKGDKPADKDEPKTSPQAQETDCRAHCRKKDYSVIEVYRDIERYRIGKRMVEPSGTRADRPQLKRMLADAKAGRFDVIVAWREDRLYRGYRPMLDVLDALDETGIDIELAMEHFDKRMAPVKAWAARMELEAKHDRFMMGVAGRLAKGLPWLPNPPYGYAKVDGKLVIHEPEAKWVRKMWGWWAEGMAGKEIRRRLIAGGARQRRGGKHAWAVTKIYKLFRTECYHTGKIRIDWDGQEYQCDIPPLVDANTAALAQARADKWKKYPAGHIKVQALAAGVIYCKTCGWKMMAVGHRRGEGIYQTYRCPKAGIVGARPDGCAGEVAMGRVDRETWDKLWQLFSDPDEFQRRLQDHITKVRGQEQEVEVDVDKLRTQLGDFFVQRQMVITDWRHKEISTADRDFQMAAIKMEQTEVEEELRRASSSVGTRSEKLMAAAEIFRAHAVTGFEKVNAVADTPERVRLQFEARRKLVEAFVTRVTISPDKAVEVTTEFDIDVEKPIAVDWPIRNISGPLTR